MSARLGARGGLRKAHHAPHRVHPDVGTGKTVLAIGMADGMEANYDRMEWMLLAPDVPAAFSRLGGPSLAATLDIVDDQG